MRRILFLLLLTAAAGAGDDVLERARVRMRALEQDICELIDKVSPAVGAVVNHHALFDDMTGKVTMRPRSLGSGLVVSADGFFLTNVHVVAGAGYITVALSDGVRYPAVLHADTRQGAVKGDIALLKLRGKKRFPFVDWRKGRSAALTPGSFVFAMGNPHGHALDGTPVVTMGIISGAGRAAALTGYLYVDALQTDAEINPGNSGGPLFDIRGQFMGINGLMASRQGRSNSGVGFAIPADQVRLFMRDLMRTEGGGVGYGYHGLHVESAPKEGGAHVRRVDRGSPADEAGLRKGDIVVRINRKRIKNRTDFVNVLGKLPEETFVHISHKRGRKSRLSKFRLVAYSRYLESIGRSRRREGKLPLNERGFLGAWWEEGKRKTEVRLTKVLEGFGADKAGLRSGDTLLEIDEKVIASAKVLVAVLEELPVAATIHVVYERDGKRRKAKVVLCDAADTAGLSG